jgi:hypothetical protein
MKKLLFSTLILLAIGANAQETKDTTEIKPAAKGVVYGEFLNTTGAILNVSDLKLQNDNATFDGKVSGRVKEVCKSMGCWIKLEKPDGTTVTVKSKDHAYFMPQDLVGHTVIVDGVAKVKEVSEEDRKHLAEDAGKSKEEVKKIKGSTKEVQIIAKGVQVVD